MRYEDMTDDDRAVVDAAYARSAGVTPRTAPRDNGVALDQFNDGLRASPAWQAFIQRSGFQPGGRIKLSDSQRQALQRELEAAGVRLPEGMNVDPAGNINQVAGVLKNRWVQIGLGSAAALATMGAAGFGPLAGVLSGGGGGAAAAGGAGAAGASGVGAAGTAAGVAGAALKTSDVVRDILSAGGAALGAGADAMAGNRSAGIDVAALQEQLDQQRQTNRRAATRDASSTLSRVDYLSDPSRYRAPDVAGQYQRSVMTNRPPLDPAVAESMRAEAVRTLTENPGAFQIDPELLRAGGVEKAAGIGSVAATVASEIPASVWARLGKLIR